MEHESLTCIFIHIECLNIFEWNFPVSMVFNQFFIHPQWSASGRQTKYKIPTANEIVYEIIKKMNEKRNDKAYLSGPGLKSLTRFSTYLAAHSPTRSELSKIMRRILPLWAQLSQYWNEIKVCFFLMSEQWIDKCVVGFISFSFFHFFYQHIWMHWFWWKSKR